MENLVNRATQAFPVWVLVFSLGALWQPQYFTWFSGPWITYGLGVIMLSMGLALKPSDFMRVFQYPRWILIGFALQFSVMPTFGWLLSKLFSLPNPFAVGLILVSCCPGGTASNVIAYLARANIALSVTMTAMSTLAAIIMTPMLTYNLAGSRLEVDAFGLFVSTTQVVLLPVGLGLFLNQFTPKVAQRASKVSPLIAVLLVSMIVSSIIGSGKDKIIQGGFVLISAVIILHLFGFAFGYGISYFLTKNEAVSKTISIEVGMQNSGLGAFLAKQHFPPGLGVDIPSAVSALTHCIFGSLLAAFWGPRQKSTEDNPTETN